MIYWFIWGLAHLLVRILYRVSYTGGDMVPRRGPVILCANHLGWWDPVILGIACRRRVYFMAKSELFGYFGFAQLLWALGAYPVKRGAPDRWALEHTLKLLEQGKAVGIFPEGTRDRSGTFRRAEPGVGQMILKSGAPVVPGYFQGPYGFRRPVKLTLGEPVSLDLRMEGDLTGAQRRQAVADAVMLRIAELGGRTADYPYAGGESGGESRSWTGPGGSDTAISRGQE
jgi:1-acyl-sn-glycerol-3-phosphate acyltransferase